MQTLRALVYLLLGMIILLPIAAHGEQESSSTNAKERLAQLIQEKKQSNSAGNLPQLQTPLAPSGVELNDENKAIQQQAISKYFQHVIKSNEHQRRVFHWQLLSAKIIFAIVILLVASGIYFAAVQFHHGIRSGKTAEQ